MISYKEENFVSAVVYLHNHEKIIRPFLQQISELLDANFKNFEIICVDDESSDDTVSQVKAAAQDMDHCTVSIVKLNNYQGYEAAMNAGVDMAIGDYVLEFDSPVMDYDVSLILDAYQKTGQGYDIVVVTNSLYKPASSHIFYGIFNQGAKLQYAIHSESFRVVSRRAINKVYSMSRTIKYRKAFYANCGLKTFCLEYNGSKDLMRYHEKDTAYRVDTAVTALVLFTDTAYKVSLGISLFMMLATIFMAIYSVCTFILHRAIEGFTTTMLVMTGSFFAVFFLFAAVIKYLSVIVQLIFQKQDYRIESVEKITK